MELALRVLTAGLPTPWPTTEYSANLRLILCANSTSKIIGPIRSRCLLMRVGAPTEEEVRWCRTTAAMNA